MRLLLLAGIATCIAGDLRLFFDKAKPLRCFYSSIFLVQQGMPPSSRSLLANLFAVWSGAAFPASAQMHPQEPQQRTNPVPAFDILEMNERSVDYYPIPSHAAINLDILLRSRPV